MLPCRTLLLCSTFLYYLSYRGTDAFEFQDVVRTLMTQDDPVVRARKTYYQHNWLYYFDYKLDDVSQELKDAVAKDDTELVEKLFHEENFTDGDSEKICALSRLSVIERGGDTDVAKFIVRLAFDVDLDLPEPPLDAPTCVESLLRDIDYTELVLRSLERVGGKIIFPPINRYDITYIHILARDEVWFVVDVLLKRLVDIEKQTPNLVDPGGFSIFHALCAGTNADLLQRFLERQPDGFNVNAALPTGVDFRPGYTGLHFAYERCRFETVNLLLERGADAHLRDAAGKKPFEVRCRARWYDSEYGASESEYCKLGDEV